MNDLLHMALALAGVVVIAAVFWFTFRSPPSRKEHVAWPTISAEEMGDGHRLPD